jgi:hypothetical protein
MKHFIFALLLILSKSILYAQKAEERMDNRPSNNIHINILGDASWISINYERRFLVRAAYFFTAKLGYGYNEEFQICIWDNACSSNHTYITVPHHITVNVGNGRHFLEAGIGGTAILGNTDQNYLIYPILGYRLHPLRKNKINFRIYGEVPFSGLLTEDILFIPFGMSLGFCF